MPVLTWLTASIASAVLDRLFFTLPGLELAPGKVQAFEHIFQAACQDGAGRNMDYDCEYPRSEFLRYLVAHKPVLLHGSNSQSIETLLPKQGRGRDRPLTDLGLVCYNESTTVTQKEVRMITLTELAAMQLQHLIEQKDLPDQGVRIFVHAGGCAGLQYGMHYEREAREGDITVEAKGVRLFVDPFSVSYLEGACIDYQEMLMGGGFRVDNPNALVTCACGLSFRVKGAEESEDTSTE